MNRMTLAFLLRQVVEHGLEALLELAAILRAGDQRAHVERENALVAQAFRHFAVDDALGETFDDRGLADAGLADQHRIVLGASLQHLDGAADLVVAADDRIELALLRALGEVDRVLLQRLPAFLGVRVVHFLAAAHFLDGLVDRALHGAGLAQDRRRARPCLRAPQARTARWKCTGRRASARVLSVRFRSRLSSFEMCTSPALPSTLASAVERLAELRAQQVDVDAGLVEQGPHRAALLVQQGRHHVQRLDVLVVAADRERLGIGQRLLEFAGQFVHAHGGNVGDKPRNSTGQLGAGREKPGKVSAAAIRGPPGPASMLRC